MSKNGFQSNERLEDAIIMDIRDTFFEEKGFSDYQIRETIPFKNALNRITNPPTAFNYPKFKRSAEYHLFPEEIQDKLIKLSQTLIEKKEKLSKKIEEEIEEVLLSDQIEGSIQELNNLIQDFPGSGIDFRITQPLIETIWYFRRLGISDENVNKTTELILELEKKVRGKKRKHQPSRWQPEKKELVFSHFLDVTRTTCGAMEEFMAHWDLLPKEEQEIIFPYLKENKLIVLILLALLHDYVEDNFLSLQEIKELLSNLGFNKNTVEETIELLPNLNINNFITENGQNDHRSYIKAISGNFATLLTKNSDIFSNFRSGIPKNLTFKNGQIENEHKRKKYDIYKTLLQFSSRYKASHFTPLEFIEEIEKNNHQDFYTNVFKILRRNSAQAQSEII